MFFTNQTFKDTMNAHQNRLAWKILMKMTLVTVAFVIKALDIKRKNEGPLMLLTIFHHSEQTYGSCSDFNDGYNLLLKLFNQCSLYFFEVQRLNNKKAAWEANEAAIDRIQCEDVDECTEINECAFDSV